jgi:NAD(P)H-dependent FMN reductase
MKKKVFAIIGSASRNSSNLRLVNLVADSCRDKFDFTIFEELAGLPHFDPVLSVEGAPSVVEEFRRQVAQADIILVSTPEYVFSIPSGLKNAIEWCVATTVFSDKPTAIITASAHGQKGHEELQLVLRTVGAILHEKSMLLIQGIKGKINESGVIVDMKTQQQVDGFIGAFREM